MIKLGSTSSSPSGKPVGKILKISAILVLLIFVVGYLTSSSSPQHNIITHPINAITGAGGFSGYNFAPPKPANDASTVEFWGRVAEVLTNKRPSFDEVARVERDFAFLAYHNDQRQKRPDNLNLTDEQFSELKTLRSEVIEEFKQLAPRLPYNPGTRGIITTAPNNAFSILTTSLWLLRSVGSNLPVEVWIGKREESEGIPCDVIFKSLNAHCMFFEDYLPDDMDPPLEIVKFTYKPLAMLFSSFEEVLFLDDDVIPVMRPDRIFDSAPYNTTGAVFWPDYWADTASHYMYELSDLPIPELDERATTESGQMLVNKRTHGAGLLLATWYNHWGPRHWHRLASQGGAGEGDKDLYIFGMRAFDLPWHQVTENPQRVGFHCKADKKPLGSAQSHPLDDWTITEAGVVRGTTDMVSFGSSLHPRILFIHANLPKLDPYMLLEWRRMEGWENMMRCRASHHAHRLYGPPELTVPKYGWDFERAVWDSFMWSTCTHTKDYRIWNEPSWWRAHPDTSQLCANITSIWDEMFPNDRWSREVPLAVDHLQEHSWGIKS